MYYPLDPLHQVFCKFFIFQLASLQCVSRSQGVFSLNGHFISRIELCGVVVRRDEKEGRLLFALDDSTALIEALVWEKRFDREAPIDWEKIVLGALVRVRGRLSLYQDRPQLTVVAVDFLPEGAEGALQEMEQWQLCKDLYETHYTTPFQLQQNAENERQFLRNLVGEEEWGQTDNVMECLGRAFMVLSSAEKGIEKEKIIREKVGGNKYVVREALTLLCSNGGAYWGDDQTETLVIQIRPEGNLAEAVLEVVEGAAEEGIVEAAVLNVLNTEPRWERVRADQVRASLDYLAQESKIFDNGLAWKKV